MAELGLFGITVADADGGAGADALAYALVMEELARGYAAIADQCGLVELVGGLLAQHGSADQKAKYLGPLLRAERRAPTPSRSRMPAMSPRSAPRRRRPRAAGGWMAPSSGSTTRRSAISRWCWRAPIPARDAAA